jgi:hypothetical protein
VRTFVAFCDTLVPADALTPAASALGVPKEILADLQGQPLGERLLVAGCDWLDRECRGDFAAASEALRDAALQKMQAMPWESPGGRFFVVMRKHRHGRLLRAAARLARPRARPAAAAARLLRRGALGAMADSPYDAVVVGAGAGGAAAAWRMTQRGWKVLLIDAGPAFDPERDYGLDRNDWERERFRTSRAARAR